MDVSRTNWAGNVRFLAAGFHRPTSIAELQQLVARSARIRVLGTGHSFNRIADTTGDLVSVAGLPRQIDIDSDRRQVRVGAGTRYGELGQALEPAGYALANTGSLPHISVAGASSTGTHGSGNGNRNLATVVGAIDLVTADGELVTLSRDRQGEQFNGMVLALGSLGVMTSLTLDIVPSYRIRQDVYDGLADASLDTDLGDIMAGGYSVSLFSDWTTPRLHQVWRKRVHTGDGADDEEADWHGAVRATTPRHPLPGMPTDHTTEQLGVPGPWNERLPHFRLDFTPSSGEELQSEYLVPVDRAIDAIRSLDDIADRIASVLQIGEIRTVAADDLWISPSHRTGTLCLHFTWVADQERVTPVLGAIEDRLKPFRARPHWGKLFVMDWPELVGLYDRFDDFRQLVRTFDPARKFRNEWSGW